MDANSQEISLFQLIIRNMALILGEVDALHAMCGKASAKDSEGRQLRYKDVLRFSFWFNAVKCVFATPYYTRQSNTCLSTC